MFTSGRLTCLERFGGFFAFQRNIVYITANNTRDVGIDQQTLTQQL